MKRFLVSVTAIVALTNVVEAKVDHQDPKAKPATEVKHDDHQEDKDHKAPHHSGSEHDDHHDKSGSESWDKETKIAEHGAGQGPQSDHSEDPDLEHHDKARDEHELGDHHDDHSKGDHLHDNSKGDHHEDHVKH